MSPYLELSRAQVSLLEAAILDEEALRVASRAWSHALQLTEPVRNQLVESLRALRAGPSQLLEKAARAVLPADLSGMEYQLQRRADTVAAQIAPWITGTSLLDYGCGDGRIVSRCTAGMQRLALYDLDDVGPRSSPFGELLDAPVNQVASLSQCWDTVLVLTVLHHSESPLQTLADAAACATQRLIVIESCVWDDSGLLVQHSPVTELKGESARHYAVLTDWFYNRVVYSGICVPFNFAGPKYWMEQIERNGFQVVHAKDLGVDIPIVPEHHFLIVADKVA